MSRITLAVTLAVSLIVLADQWTSVSACKCLPLPKPAYCRTKFLALLKITGQSEDLITRSRNYSFQLLTDLTPLRKSEGKTLAGFSSMSSPLMSANCAVKLETNQTYLIGGNFHHKTDEPFLFSCHSYNEKWNFDVERESQEKLNLYMAECESYDKQLKEQMEQNA